MGISGFTFELTRPLWLAGLAGRPDASSLAELPAPVPEEPAVINRNPAPQPWVPRPPHNLAA